MAELEAEASVVRSLYPKMLLDPHLLIIYPFAGFFYVAPENTELAAAIQTGFERVIADGSYQRLVEEAIMTPWFCLLYTSPSPRDQRGSRMPSSA